MFVDTPGIGSGTEKILNQRLLEYIPRSIACIFIIRSVDNAGVHHDRVMLQYI